MFISNITSNKDLPEEVMVEILSRLPVISLMRFMCISKKIYALVESRAFVSKHLQNYSDEYNRLVVSHKYYDETGVSFPTALFMDETMKDISYQNLHQSKNGQLHGPYSGIFGIYWKNRLTLWNPATKESKSIPKHELVIPPYTFLFDKVAFAFRLDSTSNNYKLLFINALYFERQRSEYAHVSIYKSDTNSWNDFRGNGIINYHIMGDTVDVNGICYWMTVPPNAEDDWYTDSILSFDMENEVFKEINGLIYNYEFAQLGVYNYSLSMLFIYPEKNICFEIWVMQELSWVKQLMFQSHNVKLLRPSGFWKNYACFHEDPTSQMLIHNTTTNEYKFLGIEGAGSEVCSYKESLVRLKIKDDLSDLRAIS